MKIKCRCVGRIYYTGDNEIIGYRLADSTYAYKDITAEGLKSLIADGKVEVTNLTLSSDNRLILKGEKVATINIDRKKSPSGKIYRALTAAAKFANDIDPNTTIVACEREIWFTQEFKKIVQRDSAITNKDVREYMDKTFSNLLKNHRPEINKLLYTVNKDSEPNRKLSVRQGTFLWLILVNVLPEDPASLITDLGDSDYYLSYIFPILDDFNINW